MINEGFAEAAMMPGHCRMLMIDFVPSLPFFCTQKRSVNAAISIQTEPTSSVFMMPQRVNVVGPAHQSSSVSLNRLCQLS